MVNRTFNHIAFILAIILISTNTYNCNSIAKEIGPITEKDYSTIQNYLKEIKKYFTIIKSSESETNFSKQNLTTIFDDINDHKDGYICKTCLFTFRSYHNLLKLKYGLSILEEIIALICSIWQDRSVCRGAIGNYGADAIDAVIDRFINPEKICNHRFICEHSHFNYLKADDYANRLLKNKPAKKELKVNNQAKEWRFVHVSDIHSDFQYEAVNLLFLFFREV